MANVEDQSRFDQRMRIINRARADDFAIEHLLGSGCDGLVVAARCTREGIPDNTKLYAVKMLFTFNQDDQTRRIRNRYENEWKILSQRSHPNVVYMWAEFIDVIPDPFYDSIPPDIQDLALYQDGPRRGTRCRAQFVVFEHHEHDMKRRRPSYPTPLPVGVAKRFASDLLEAACFLKRHRIVHLDLKLDNIMIAEDGRLVVIDFGEAKQLQSRDMKAVYVEGMSPGGNLAHLAPEVQMRFSDLSRMEIIPGQQEYIDYSGQLLWAVGSLIFELITGEHPLVNYPAAYIGHGRTIYEMSELSPLPVSYSSEFQSIVHRLLHHDVTLRCSVEEARGVIARIPDQSCQAEAMLAHPSRIEIERVSSAVETTTQTLDLLQGRVTQLECSVRDIADGFHAQRRSIDSVLANLEQIRLDMEQQRGRMVEFDSASGDINERLQLQGDVGSHVNSDATGQLRRTVDYLQAQMEEMKRDIMLSKFQALLEKKKLWDDNWVLEPPATDQDPWLVSRNCQGNVWKYLTERRILRVNSLGSHEMTDFYPTRYVLTPQFSDTDNYCVAFRFSIGNLSLRPQRLKLTSVLLFRPLIATMTKSLDYTRYEGSVTVQLCNARDANPCWLTVVQSHFSWDEDGHFKAVDAPLHTEMAYDAVKFTFTLTNNGEPVRRRSYVRIEAYLQLFGDLVMRLD